MNTTKNNEINLNRNDLKMVIDFVMSQYYQYNGEPGHFADYLIETVEGSCSFSELFKNSIIKQNVEN